ncbi:MAG: hypothetical protein ABW252_03925 [Polyangiales bacterium]
MRELSRVFLTASLITSLSVGCGGDDDDTSGTVDGGLDAGADAGKVNDASTSDAGTADVTSKASEVRTALNLLLSEHLVVAAKATGAALGARTSEYKAYGALLNSNGTEVGALIGSAYGPTAETQFNQIWSAHNGFFVDYTTGVATNNETMKTKAVNDLTTLYVPQFAALLATATALPEQTLRDLTTEHVLDTKAVVDAQAAQNWPLAYTKIREAFAHMSMIGSPLADATAKKFPTVLPGNALSKAATLRTQLNQALQEHLYLASFATGAALGGRSAEATEAIKALNANGTEIGTVITGLFGADAGTAFNQVWSAHNGFFVDYTTGVATNNETQKAQAVTNLTTMYVPQFTALIVSATKLPEATVAKLVSDHVTMTKAVVDAQAVKPVTDASWTAAAAADRMAAHHMQQLADPLASAIVAQKPGSF